MGILTWTQTRPENTRPETEQKNYKYFLGLNLFYPKEPEPKITDPNRPDPIRNDLYPT